MRRNKHQGNPNNSLRYAAFIPYALDVFVLSRMKDAFGRIKCM